MKCGKRLVILLTAVALLAGCLSLTAFGETETAVKKIVLSGHTALLDGFAVGEYDYTWHITPEQAYEEVKNSPGEYYTGTKPTEDVAVYIAHDIIYYPELEQEKFQLVSYDGDREWVYMYEAEGYENYIFSTLPALQSGFPEGMMHTPQEAYDNPVLHITQPGVYELSGQWNGQINVDLGEEAYADPTQKVTLLLNNASITCTVAPGVIFTNVYECDNTWEEKEGYSHIVDTSQAGANVILADGSTNAVSGTNVYRILKTKYKDEDSQEQHPAQKKAWKIDGAFYSFQSMCIAGQEQGDGVLNITAGFEGLDSELHLTVEGGNVNIYSQDDGINVNEDGVSVLTVNGGSLHICGGLGSEGDGIDSNGFVVINGGSVISMANPAADSGLDSDCGSFVNGGTVVALGSTMDWAESDSGNTQPVLNLQLGSAQSADEAIIITDAQNIVVFAYDPDKDETAKDNQRTYRGAIISAPGLSIGESCCIYIGGDVQGTELSGIYSPDTVTGFSGAVQQCYSGTTVSGFGGGMGRPDAQGSRPERPQGDFSGNGQPPDGMEKPQGDMPEGMEFPEGMQPPEGMEMPQGGFSGGGFQGLWIMGSNGEASCTGESVFLLSKQVNAFSGVTDYRHTLQKSETGNDVCYQCQECGKLFADENGETEIMQSSEREDVTDNSILIAALIFAGISFLISAAVIATVVLRKKK